MSLGILDGGDRVRFRDEFEGGRRSDYFLEVFISPDSWGEGDFGISARVYVLFLVDRYYISIMVKRSLTEIGQESSSWGRTLGNFLEFQKGV